MNFEEFREEWKPFPAHKVAAQRYKHRKNFWDHYNQRDLANKEREVAKKEGDLKAVKKANKKHRAAAKGVERAHKRIKGGEEALKKRNLPYGVQSDEDPDNTPLWKVQKATQMEQFMEPLQELFDLYEFDISQMKPDIQDEGHATVGTPQEGDFNHPVIQQRREVDAARQSGMEPVDAHQQVHGEVNLGDIKSKAKLASTLSRVADEGSRRGVRIEPEKGSIFARDAEMEKEMDQVTHDDLRTPMRAQVPDAQQTPADQFAESLDEQEEYDYNEDVAYLQQYGRA